jgi:hypothetical protein
VPSVQIIDDRAELVGDLRGLLAINDASAGLIGDDLEYLNDIASLFGSKDRVNPSAGDMEI